MPGGVSADSPDDVAGEFGGVHVDGFDRPGMDELQEDPAEPPSRAAESPHATDRSGQAAHGAPASEPADVAPTLAHPAPQAWEEYRRSGDAHLRDQLILHYSPLVRYVADRMRVGLPAHVDPGDLYSAGTFGLIDAVDRYDPDLGVPFEPYARSRIRGAVLDELRSIDWVPRSVRRRARQVEVAMAECQREFQRTPTDEEVAERAGLTLAELQQLYRGLSLAHVAALDEVLRSRPAVHERHLADPAAPDPLMAVEQADEMRSLREAIAELPERDQVLLSLYYFEGFTMAEVGLALDITESRVSQLHTRAMLRLRTSLSQSEAGSSQGPAAED